MERLTDKLRSRCDFCDAVADEDCPYDGHDPVCMDAKRYERLALIEDILGETYDLDRLRELMEACKGLEASEIEESKLLIATRKDP